MDWGFCWRALKYETIFVTHPYVRKVASVQKQTLFFLAKHFAASASSQKLANKATAEKDFHLLDTKISVGRLDAHLTINNN